MDEREMKMFWQMVFCASIAAGKSVQGATKNANEAQAPYKERFTKVGEDDED